MNALTMVQVEYCVLKAFESEPALRHDRVAVAFFHHAKFLGVN